MGALNNVHDRMAPMAALAGAAVIVTAAAVHPIPVQRAVDRIETAVAHEVKSLPVQLTGVDLFYPYAQPNTPLGIAVTLPLFTATTALQPVVQQLTQALAGARIDNRIAQQPQVLMQNFVLPIAVGTQISVVGLLGGTYVFGQFTPAQALKFFATSIAGALIATANAERVLLGLPSLAAMKPAAQTPSDQSIASKPDPVAVSSVSQVDTLKKPVAKPSEKQATTGDSGDASKSAGEVSKPKAPTRKAFSLKLPTFKPPVAPPKLGNPFSAGRGSGAKGSSKDTGTEGSSKDAAPKSPSK